MNGECIHELLLEDPCGMCRRLCGDSARLVLVVGEDKVRRSDLYGIPPADVWVDRIEVGAVHA